MKDYLFSRRNAESLARQIEKYWRQKGLLVSTYVETEPYGQKTLYSIRSNIVQMWREKYVQIKSKPRIPERILREHLRS